MLNSILFFALTSQLNAWDYVRVPEQTFLYLGNVTINIVSRISALQIYSFSLRDTPTPSLKVKYNLFQNPYSGKTT